ncbi:MAG: DUF262 domain-containing protein [bacterium]|nr:DUF262 domain-containing protein [bacterium]
MQKYSVNQYQISNILNWVESGEVALPEIQRPFVWSSTKVRDLLDSLYRGYPIGYVISWRNPDVRTKDGSLSAGRKILIDGQQRVTALRAAVLGHSVVNKEYKEIRIRISFNPLTEEFATLTPAIEKDSLWINDISEVLSQDSSLLERVGDYLEANPETDRKLVEKRFTKLLEIKNKPVGFIELESTLDIETVTEIFIRINSKGMILSQADFVMSKIASYGEFGVNLRKLIDYFCHLAREPHFYKHIAQNDEHFAASDYFQKILWLKNESDDLYDPSYSDVIRVAFTKEFGRGKLPDLVSLLAGRNFETRTYEEQITKNSFKKLEKGILHFVSEFDFKQFAMLIKSTGFVSPNLIRSRNALNFAYALYLRLRDQKFDPNSLNKLVARWFVMSIITSRYTAASESQIDEDIRLISRRGLIAALEGVEKSLLTDAFWEVGLPQELDKAGSNNPMLSVFFASQAKAKNKGFLSSDILVGDMIQLRGDIHHVFPNDYLKKSGVERDRINQIANFVYAETGINVRIGNKSPKQYFKEVQNQMSGGALRYGSIADKAELTKNLRQNCIPPTIFEMEFGDYENFLEQRRKLMAQKIQKYYQSL